MCRGDCPLPSSPPLRGRGDCRRSAPSTATAGEGWGGGRRVLVADRAGEPRPGGCRRAGCRGAGPARPAISVLRIDIFTNRPARTPSARPPVTSRATASAASR
ncbi:hypothetical protein DS843_11010 [Roseomonas genomospecies 6]|uniref:Uncharacterized protein n=1 Tax=Roseomonas genomospecies 6 TaxID=214106 RepID=A0A9W7NJW5_9PROT|nr:hypothetical protein DS843_11010 [Roseomonas genomospecies 6]